MSTSNLHPMDIKPVVLEGKYVRLEPMTSESITDLCEVGLDPTLWALTTVSIKTPQDMREYVESALKDQAAGTALPFVTRYKPDDRIVGSTRFGNIDRANRRLEIGWTWVSPGWQRTVVNTEAKFLQFQHSFEVLGCNRVELKTDSLNDRSRNAILRIGAKEEGTLRNHMVVHDGRLRHSVYFSVIASEWPEVKANLGRMIER